MNVNGIELPGTVRRARIRAGFLRKRVEAYVRGSPLRRFSKACTCATVLVRYVMRYDLGTYERVSVARTQEPQY